MTRTHDMTRTYDMTSMEVLPQLDAHTDVVIKLNFTYGDAEASLNGSCTLVQPENEFLPLDQISKETALSWLLDQCLNTTEEFDSQLDRELAEKANEPFVYDWSEPYPEISEEGLEA
jgi:hypothetical protein